MHVSKNKYLGCTLCEWKSAFQDLPPSQLPAGLSAWLCAWEAGLGPPSRSPNQHSCGNCPGLWTRSPSTAQGPFPPIISTDSSGRLDVTYMPAFYCLSFPALPPRSTSTDTWSWRAFVGAQLLLAWPARCYPESCGFLEVLLWQFHQTSSPPLITLLPACICCDCRDCLLCSPQEG